MKKITKKALSFVLFTLLGAGTVFGQSTTIENTVYIFLQETDFSNVVKNGGMVISSNGILYSGRALALTNGASGVNFGSLSVSGTPVVTNPIAASLTLNNTSQWDSAYAWVNTYSNGTAYMLGRTNEWNAAWNWGNHATNGYPSTNNSVTMAPGTEWTFSRANVTNNATNGTMALNYRSGTNLFVGLLGPGTGNKEINISYAEKAAAYFEITLPVSPAWADVSSIIFSGSREWGTPDRWSVLSGSVDGDPPLNFRLYDSANAQTIATITNIASVAATISFTTNLANIPTNNAIFVIQAQRPTSGNNNLRIFGVQLRQTSNATK